MKEEIYEYLRNFGFTQDELKKIKERNEDIYFVTLNKVKENIIYITNLGLSNIELIDLVNINPFYLTLSIKRKDAFDSVYVNKLNLSQEEIKFLLSVNKDLYTCSFIELEKIVNYLNFEKNYSYEEIKKIFLSNPDLINKKYEEIIKIV